MAGPRSNPQIALRPQDVVVLLRLSLEKGEPPTYATLSEELGITASEVHAAIERAALAQLAVKNRSGKASVVREALRLFLQHGARYAFPAMRGEMTRGVPTGYAAAPLRDRIQQPNDPPPVWPDKNGSVRGEAFIPLYPAVPSAAARNPALYELLVLFDAIRGGRARERELAISLLNERLAA